MKTNSILLLVAVLVLIAATGCGNAQSAHQNLDEIQENDSLPDIVKKLVKSVYLSDTVAFANLISYPLTRPYPLHDIPDIKEMEKYYPVLVDDSLHKVISSSVPAEWNEYGWRGWSLAEGQYLWLDEESIYSINYLSYIEKNRLDSLANLEISTLTPELRKGNWNPVTCMRASDGNTVYRIDLDKNPHKSPAYRMAEFSSPSTMRQAPQRIYTGYMYTEGSASIATYHFTSSDGTKADYTPDSPDGTSVIDITAPDGKNTKIEVIPAYWLDLLLLKQR